MTDAFKPEQIREYWTRQAGDHGLSPAASWSDVSVIEMEIREIQGRLAEGDCVLDVGCANGYSTLRYATRLKLDIKGVDFIPEMVQQARKRLQDLRETIRGTVAFDTGDITAARIRAVASACRPGGA